MGSRFFVGAYLVLQLAVALFSFRYWPLTDYPMFSAVYDQLTPIESYRLQGITKDGRKEWLPRGATGYLGHSDFKLSSLIQGHQWDRAKKMLIDSLKKSPREFLDPYERIVVVRRVIKRSGQPFIEEDHPVLEIVLTDLLRAEVPQ